MMYTIEQLREVIKAELDKQEYVEEPILILCSNRSNILWKMGESDFGLY